MISIDVNDRLGEEQVAVNKKTQQVSMINWKGDILALKEEVIKENRYTDFSDYKSQHLLWTKMNIETRERNVIHALKPQNQLEDLVAIIALTWPKLFTKMA